MGGSVEIRHLLLVFDRILLCRRKFVHPQSVISVKSTKMRKLSSLGLLIAQTDDV